MAVGIKLLGLVNHGCGDIPIFVLDLIGKIGLTRMLL